MLRWADWSVSRLGTPRPSAASSSMILIVAYMPSKAGWNRGKTNPPEPSPANATPSRAEVQTTVNRLRAAHALRSITKGDYPTDAVFGQRLINPLAPESASARTAIEQAPGA